MLAEQRAGAPLDADMTSVVSNDLVAFYLSLFSGCTAAEQARVLTLTLVHGIRSLQRDGHALQLLAQGGVAALERAVQHSAASPAAAPPAPAARPPSPARPASPGRKPAATLTPTFGLYPSWWGHREHSPSRLVQVRDRTGRVHLVAANEPRPTAAASADTGENLRIGGWVTDAVLQQQPLTANQEIAAAAEAGADDFEQLTSPLQNWRFPRRMIDEMTQTASAKFSPAPVPPVAQRFEIEAESGDNSPLYYDNTPPRTRASRPEATVDEPARRRGRRRTTARGHGSTLVEAPRLSAAAAPEPPAPKRPGQWYTILLGDGADESPKIVYGPGQPRSRGPSARAAAPDDDDADATAAAAEASEPLPAAGPTGAAEDEETRLFEEELDASLAQVVSSPPRPAERPAAFEIPARASAQSNRSTAESRASESTRGLGDETDDGHDTIVYQRRPPAVTSPARSGRSGRSSAARRERRRAKNAAVSPSLGSLGAFSVQSGRSQSKASSTAPTAQSGTSALDIALSILNDNDFMNALDLSALAIDAGDD